MKSQISLTLVALLAIAVAVFAGSSGLAKNDLPANADATAHRFTVQGKGDSRLMFDSQTGETWVLKTMLQGVTENDPSPMTVWFPVPRADDSLVKAIVLRRSDELTQMQEGQGVTYAKFLAEKEEELGSDHPFVVKERKQLERLREVWTDYRKHVEAVFAH